MRLILGIDPGSRTTGFALLRSKKPLPLVPRDFSVVEAGVLRADAALPYAQRIGLLHIALCELLMEHRPDVCVIEKAFFDKNVNSALKLGELRGAYIAACARSEVPVAELTPADVKKTIAGNGRADKEAIALALHALLGFNRGSLPHDATDALAISLCHGLKSALTSLDGMSGRAMTRPRLPTLRR
ncbi:MAG: crossover junction endodeoxyribonuclease RuvC [Deltaproteobacteria bacterium]|nr:crossover junction endodeoxyribonuclease RuvC [Deltaproteobacteria bacterium]